MHGGKVEQIKDNNGEYVGPYRIWLRDKEIPGLAMSRSFGDRVAASVGCISSPEIFEYDLKVDDKFVILASDGVWEFISSSECVSIVKEFYIKNDAKNCLEYLYDVASSKWIDEENAIDDITIILVFFNS